VSGAASRREWLGFWLSMLCLVHCAGTALLVPLLPALSFFAVNPSIEWTLLGLSVVLAGRFSWRWGGLRRQLWALATGLGVAGLVFETDRLLQVALAILAVIQLGRLRRKRCDCGDPACRL
jgi:hypothetical protein